MHYARSAFPSSYFYTRRPAGSDNVCGSATNCEEWGWGALILPYIEQQNLYNQLGVIQYSLHHVLAKKNPGLPNPSQMLQTNLSIYRCPSDSSPGGDLLPSPDR